MLCLLAHALAFSVTSGPVLPRRTLLQAPAVAASVPAASADRAAAFDHELTSMKLQGVSVPVAVWRPAPESAMPAASPATYPYKIDIGKIAAKLRVGWLTWLPKFDYALPVGASQPPPLPGFARARSDDCILFAHGFLGSVYDFAHAAEALAADGFTVVAPELPESLSASYIPPDDLTREEIIASARELVGKPGGRWGIFGHSAGAGSALMQRGVYALGRACFAGGAARLGTYSGEDPLWICSSNGDGCNKFLGSGDVDLRPTIVAADRKTVLFDQLSDAFATPGKPPPRRGAFVFASDNTPSPLPSHISFLWSEVDEAMISLLSPFLPLAKALGLFVLDFDVYLETRDAERTAQQLVPALRRFFLSSSGG